MKRIYVGQPCDVDDCAHRPIARGWCRNHYNQWHRRGAPTPPWATDVTPLDVTDIDVAWFAGLFEGEGSISLRSDSLGTVLVLAMTDEDVVRRVQHLFGGSVTDKQPPGNRKRIWRWVLSNGVAVAEVLELILPHLGVRRSARANKALDRLHASSVPYSR